MRANYDFSQAVRNPYAKRLKKQLTIRLDMETIRYFQKLAEEIGIPYQTLMNMYLRDCAETRKRPHWVGAVRGKDNSRMQRTVRSRKARADGR